MSYLDVKYVNMLSSQLDKFKRKSGNLWNFRCPICGDSETHKNKARGYVYDRGGTFWYTCHNQCGTMPFKKFLKEVSPLLHKEYVSESFVDANTKIKTSNEILKKIEYVYPDRSPLSVLKKVSQLDWKHPCKKYVESRQIPNIWHSKLYFAPKYMEFVNSLIPEKFSPNSLKFKDEARLVIPFFTKDSKVFGFQGRSLDPDAEVRYISIILDESKPKVFGLDTVDLDRTHYLFEGPLDAIFIPNAVACAGGDLLTTAHYLNKDKLVFVYDNEPRHKDTIKLMRKTIARGFKICLWPEEIREKDINAMILSGLDADFIKNTIEKNTYSDLEAELAFSKWCKI